MRLWHKDLIKVIPRQQLLSQWRECCCIARNIAVNGTPNHILVNEVLEYPENHFNYYGQLVGAELAHRGYFVCGDRFDQWLRNEKGELPYPYPEFDKLFEGWHNDRYLTQCFYNLQEKFDRGGITPDEWEKIDNFYMAAMKYRINHHFGIGGLEYGKQSTNQGK